MSKLERALVLLVREAHRSKFWAPSGGKTILVYTDESCTVIGEGDLPSEAVTSLGQQLLETRQIGLGQTILSIMGEAGT